MKYTLVPPMPQKPGNTHNGKPVLAPGAKLISVPTDKTMQSALDWQTVHQFLHSRDEDDMRPSSLSPIQFHHASR